MLCIDAEREAGLASSAARTYTTGMRAAGLLGSAGIGPLVNEHTHLPPHPCRR